MPEGLGFSFHRCGVNAAGRLLLLFLLCPALLPAQESPRKPRTFLSIYSDCAAPAVLAGPNFSRSFKGVVQFSGGLSLHSIKRKASLGLLYQFVSVQAGINALALPTNIFTVVQMQSLLLQVNKRLYSDALWDFQVFAAGGKTLVSAKRVLCNAPAPSFVKNTWQAGFEAGLRAQERVWVGLKISAAYYAWQFDYNDYCMGSFYNYPRTSRDAAVWQLYTGFYARVMLGSNGSED